MSGKTGFFHEWFQNFFLFLWSWVFVVDSHQLIPAPCFCLFFLGRPSCLSFPLVVFCLRWLSLSSFFAVCFIWSPALFCGFGFCFFSTLPSSFLLAYAVAVVREGSFILGYHVFASLCLLSASDYDLPGSLSICP